MAFFEDTRDFNIVGALLSTTGFGLDINIQATESQQIMESSRPYFPYPSAIEGLQPEAPPISNLRTMSSPHLSGPSQCSPRETVRISSGIS